MSPSSCSPFESVGRLAEGSSDGDVLVLRITAPEVRTAQDSQALRNELLQMAQQSGRARIVVDLELVRFIGSAGLLGFLSLRRQAAQQPDGEVVLCHASEDIRALLEVCRLIPAAPGQPAAFQVAPTRQAALDLLHRA